MDNSSEPSYVRADVWIASNHDDIDLKRRSHVEDYLSDDEREFLWLVSLGDLEGIKNILKTKTIDHNCCDYRGQRALDIAISNQDFRVVTFLLDTLRVTTTHYYCAILRSVFENEADILELLLDRAEEDSTLYSNLKDLINGGPECIKCLPDVAASNLTPTMTAVINGNLEITRILLERGYYIQKPHPTRCECNEQCSKKAQNGETLTDSIDRMNAYRALSSPTYLILTSRDPILAAFKMGQEMKKLSRELPENQKEYKDLSTQCSKFATALLNQCRNTDEVQTVLVQRGGLKDPRPHRFSRLHLAVQYEQKEFVTHASCQQVLRSMWVESLGSWYSWPFRLRAFHVVKHAILTPFVSLAFIFIPKAEIIGPLRVPLNRFIYFATSYSFFLCLLMATLLNDRRYDIHSPVTWTEIAVGCFIVGHSWDICTNLMSVGFSNYFRSWWAVFDLTMFLLFLLTEILWFSVFVLTLFYPHVTENSNRMCWHWYHPILLGEGIYAAASIMAFCRLMLWFQVNSRLGPLGTSIIYMVVDVVRFFMLFFIIMLAFATGINSLYKNYRDSARYEDGELIEQPEDFVTLRRTFKSLFWSIFGMGEPDFAQVIAGRQIQVNETEFIQQESEHFFTEGVGYTLWGLYHMITVIVLVNMLIAMMAESYQRVQANADMEWKFACSRLWLSVFDNHSVVPPPFNLIPSMHRITLLIRWIIGSVTRTLDERHGKLSWSRKRCCYWSSEIDHTAQKIEEENYERLMVQLIRRYLQTGGMQLRSSSILSAEIKEKLKEEIVQELFRSLNIQNRYKRRCSRRTVRRGENTVVKEPMCQQKNINC